MPKAVLWDFGNVIVRWDPRTLYAKIFPDASERDRFLAEVCTMAWHVETDRGVTFADNCARLAAQHPHHADAIWAWRHRWEEMFSGTIPETEAAIEALHAAGVPQFGLSNISTETLDSTLAMSPAFGRLQGVVASGREGLIKPQPEIFHLACERFGYAPQDFLFVDDGAHNIAAASALGFDVHHFTDPASLRPALEARKLL
ncbi:HAD family hydrolase [Phenylobacterium soli]|uniref:HAD family phosphatase n=1 Tax=Phenylobacterium soli TaxID=2170551 RepID=A0A328AER6_9CAUL|nr:HAD family phosphatase [Phenylobacterium soli]RAK53190.1 HAD family phosphatase [Phenylobacterium soli]